MRKLNCTKKSGNGFESQTVAAFSITVKLFPKPNTSHPYISEYLLYLFSASALPCSNNFSAFSGKLRVSEL